MKQQFCKLLPFAAVSLAACVCLFSYWVDSLELFSGPTVGVVHMDSDQYWQFAHQIIGKSAPPLWELTNFQPGAEARSPGYPTILASAIYLVGSSAWAILVAHFIIWLMAAVLIFFSQSGVIARWRVTTSFLIGSTLMAPYFHQLMTEWVTFCQLVICFALLEYFWQRKTVHALSYLLLGISGLVLIRPEYLSIIPLGLLAAYLSRAPVRKILKFSVIGLAPVILVAVFNWTRFGTFSLAQIDGQSLVAISSTLGPIADSEIEDEFLDLFSKYMHQKALYATTEDLLTLPLLWKEKGMYAKGTSNLINAYRFKQEHSNVSWYNFNSMLRRFSFRTIEAYPAKYLATVAAGLLTLIWTLPFCYPYFRLLKRVGKDAYAADLFRRRIWILATHFLHTALISACGIQHFRYYLPTFSFLCFGALLIISEIYSHSLESQKIKVER